MSPTDSGNVLFVICRYWTVILIRVSLRGEDSTIWSSDKFENQIRLAKNELHSLDKPYRQLLRDLLLTINSTIR